MRRLFQSHAAVFVAVVTLSTVYLGLRADRGWIPHDEGFLGQSAERVLQGELPHRDFDDPYTGGLTYLHALAFELFGVRLTSLRWMLLAFSIAFVAAVYAIAARVASPPAAGAATLVAIAWSLPIYFAALPSWYNLFFAAFGTLALLRHLETGGRRWLFLAGLCGGLSVLIKVVGLYYLAAALLFLVYREQQLSRETAGGDRGRPRGFRPFVAASVAVFCALLAALVARRAGLMEVIHFLLPGLCLGGLLLWNEHRLRPAGDRWGRLLGLVGPFVAGAALPVAAFLVPYLATGSWGDLLYGVLLVPQERFEFAAMALPPARTLLAALPMGLLIALPLAPGVRLRVRWPLLLGAAAAAVAIVALGDRTPVFRAVWHSVRHLTPLVTLAGCLHLARGGGETALRRQQLFLLLAMAALLSLVQYPDFFEIYFAYAAPAVVLALVYLVRSQRGAPLRLHAVALGLYLAFAVVWLHRTLPEALGTRFWKVTLDTPLAVARGGLRMPRRMADTYREIVGEIQRRSAPGSYIYATPDCPEIYFLAGRRNPTRTFFDFFDEDFGEPLIRSRRLLSLLEARRVDVVVFKTDAQFSRVPEALARGVAARYPNRIDIYPYSIYWREPRPERPQPGRGDPRR